MVCREFGAPIPLCGFSFSGGCNVWKLQVPRFARYGQSRGLRYDHSVLQMRFSATRNLAYRRYPWLCGPGTTFALGFAEYYHIATLCYMITKRGVTCVHLSFFIKMYAHGTCEYIYIGFIFCYGTKFNISYHPTYHLFFYCNIFIVIFVYTNTLLLPYRNI